MRQTSGEKTAGYSPVKNWSGRAKKNFPTRLAAKISADSVIKYNKKTFGCHFCPLACGAEVDVEKFNRDAPDKIFHLETAAGDDVIKAPHKPEYETLCSFGDMILNDSIFSIIKVNDLCNRAGIDTISCAETVAWAYDAFSLGVLTTEDTGGLELTWGKNRAGRLQAAKTLVELVKKITTAKKTDSQNKSIGEALMDGVERAAAYYDAKKGTTSSTYAYNAGKQELPMYDIRSKQTAIEMGLAVTYEVEPTPGRHTSSMPGVPESFTEQMTKPESDKRQKANPHKRIFASSRIKFRKKPKKDPEKTWEHEYAVLIKRGSCFQDIVNGCGLCNFAFGLVADKKGNDQLPLIQWLQAVTGWKDKWLKHYMKIGHRIKTIRKLFNYDKCKHPEPGIITAATEKTRGYIDDVKKFYYNQMKFDSDTGRPTEEILENLGITQMKKIEL